MDNSSFSLVSVVIVTIGAKKYIRECLDSLRCQSYSDLEVIVIDNSLDPYLASGVRESFESIRIQSNKENLYYGVSLNEGIDMTRGEFVLCLNDDIVLDKDYILRAMEGFSVNKNIGSISGKILRSNGKILDSTGLFLSIWRTAKERGYGSPDKGQFEKPGFIFGVNGAAAFYRREMLNTVKDKYGYFDSRFNMFYEDLDISWRSRRKGWLAYYVPQAVAYHVRGGSFRPDSGIDKPVGRRYLNDKLYYRLIMNRYLTISKNEGFTGFILSAVPLLIYEISSWGYTILFRPSVLGYFFRKAFDKIMLYFKIVR